MPKKETVKKNTYADFVSEFKQEFGDDSVCLDASVVPMRSGFPAIDPAIGIGGYPRGPRVMTYGEEMVGKSLTKMVTAAQCQKEGGRVAWIDMEHAFSKSLGELVGLDFDPKHWLHIKPASGDQAMEQISNMIWTGPVLSKDTKKILEYGTPRRFFDMIVLDSAAALVGDEEMMDKNTAAIIGRMLSKNLKQFVHWLDASGTTLFIINQTRKKVGLFFGKDSDATGGKALRFYSSIIEEIQRADWIKENGVIVGTKNRVKIEKNKVGAPYKIANYEFGFGEGVSKIAGLIDRAIEMGIITKKSSHFYFEEQGYNGRDALVTAIGGDYVLMDKLDAAVEGRPALTEEKDGGSGANKKK